MLKHLELLVKNQYWKFFTVAVDSSEQCLCFVNSAHRGPNHPIMHVHERSLSVLACRFVDEVIIGAPWEVSKDMVHLQPSGISLDSFHPKKFWDYSNFKIIFLSVKM